MAISFKVPNTFCFLHGDYPANQRCPGCAMEGIDQPRLKVSGVSRMADNGKALLVSLSGEPSDDDLRSLHEYLRGWRP